MIPDLPSLELKLVLNSRGRTEGSRKYYLIDSTEFPDRPGVYVLRYSGHPLSRMQGESPILKIGKADVSIRNRFKNYNHMRHVTMETKSLIDLLDELPQPTNVRLIHFLAHEKHPAPLVVDCYFPNAQETPREIEKQLLREYFSAHRELPPLNFGFH